MSASEKMAASLPKDAGGSASATAKTGDGLPCCRPR